MSSTSNLKIVQDLYTANDKRDLEAFYKDLSADIVWKESDGFPTPGTFHSRTEIMENVFSVLERDWSNFRFTLELLIDGNERIVAIGNYSGTHRQTKKEFEARASHVWEVVDGKIASFEQFADTHIMRNAMVLAPVRT